MKLFGSVLLVIVTGCVFPKPGRNSVSGVKELPVSAPDERSTVAYELKPYTSATESLKPWTDYCVGNPNAADIPSPRYDNAKVTLAAQVLSKIAPKSFSLYREVMDVYAKGGTPPKDVTQDANNFLVYLCGEFRDRSQLLNTKLDWVSQIHTLKVEDQQPIDTTMPLWPQVTTKGYSEFVIFSRNYQSAKKNELAAQKHTFGKWANVDKPTMATTICEIKFMFSEYIAKAKTWDDLAAYRLAYTNFQPKCSQKENDYYVTFRGDSNIKPNSPESNGMIFNTRSISRMCKSPTEAMDPATFSNERCAAYFSKPFNSRWNAARAGLASWLLRHSKHDEYFAQTYNNVTVLPHTEGAFRPFEFRLPANPTTALKEFLGGWSKYWTKEDFGLGELAVENSADKNEFIYSKIRDAVNRHTDWYASGYDDGFKTPKSVMTQAYSPLVASSYEMSSSDAFTAPGITVSVPSDGFKHWMFIFKVKKDNWYNTDSLAAGKPIDFENMWFDETSFGTVGLAKNENAWDRLGSPLEDEYEAIWYLHNIPTH